MKPTTTCLVLLTLALASPAAGQLPAKNAAGISPGHLHLYVSDVAAQQKFWETLGGVKTANQRLEMIQVPGVYILLRRGETKGGTVGSVVNHLGFAFKDLAAEKAKWQAAGYTIEPGADANHGYILGPDGIRLEFSGDPSLSTPMKLSHLHLFGPDVSVMQAWYAKALGGAPGNCTRAAAPDATACVDVAGVSVAFSKSDTTLEPTAGRSLDHIGFDVSNLPDFLKRMEAEGVSITQQLTPSNFITTMRVSFIADPWGTKMEITEGLAPQP
jgi:catechol 2,3-dioxygenase-like lactoylglutathione lyase family enzyme